MPDRSHIGLDNPVFYGRLRTPQRKAQSLGVNKPVVRPSVRYYNNDVITKPLKRVAASKLAVVTPPVSPIQVVKPQAFPKPPLHAPQQSLVLRRQAVHSPRTAPKKRVPKAEKSRTRNWSKPQMALMSMAVIIFLVGIAVSVITLRVDHTASSQVAALSKSAATQPATSDTTTTSSTPPPPGPSVVKPSKVAVSSYVVAPDLPKYLDIPKLYIHTRVLSLGILNNGALATPNNIYDTGWYNASAKPADPPTSGAMLIDGHAAGYNAAGIFYNLKKLVAGDTLNVTRGDGKVFTYKVVKSQEYDANNVDMQAAMTPVTPGKPGLNLITCAGDVDPHTYHFLKRMIVFAEQV